MHRIRLAVKAKVFGCEQKDSVGQDTRYIFKNTPKIGFSKPTKQRLTMPISENKLV